LKKEVQRHSQKGHKGFLLGLLNRETGEVRDKTSPSRMKKDVEPHLAENLARGSKLYTMSSRYTVTASPKS
jgi:hypothetical protein